jgi:hypothetical protein
MAASKKQQAIALQRIAFAMADAIRELGEVPSGHLYAALMEKMTLETYQRIIGMLKASGMVKESFHVLKWVGPAKGEVAAPVAE